MNNKQLNPKWDKWRRNRRAELCANGVAMETADEFALNEALGRQRIALLTGDKAAMSAELIETPDKPGFSLLLDPNLIDNEVRESAAKSLKPATVMSTDCWTDL